MERLTEWINDGESSKAVPKMKLRNNGHQRCCNKLAEYEDAEEQGLLLKLPFPIGTKILYAIDRGEIIWLNAQDMSICKTHISEKILFTIDSMEYFFEDFGEIVFLTREEAEAALERMW